MSRTREAIIMGIGILAGITLSGPAAQAATEILTASRTSQTFYLNGQKVEFEVYSIHDNNFVKIRDIAQAMDFGVTYDAATNSVHIAPNAPYQEEATSALTEATVQATIWALRKSNGRRSRRHGAPPKSFLTNKSIKILCVLLSPIALCYGTLKRFDHCWR